MLGLSLTTNSIGALGSCDVGLPCFQHTPGMGLLCAAPGQMDPSRTPWPQHHIHHKGRGRGAAYVKTPQVLTALTEIQSFVLDKNFSMLYILGKFSKS